MAMTTFEVLATFAFLDNIPRDVVEVRKGSELRVEG